VILIFSTVQKYRAEHAEIWGRNHLIESYPWCLHLWGHI